MARGGRCRAAPAPLVPARPAGASEASPPALTGLPGLARVDVLPVVSDGDSSGAVHAALRCVPASARWPRGVVLRRLGRAVELSARPAAKMFLAAFTSRSRRVPQPRTSTRGHAVARADLHPARRAHLTGGLEPADPGNVRRYRAASSSTAGEPGPAGVVHGPGQPGPRQPGHAQVLGVDRLIVADQPQRDLVRVVEPGFPYRAVQDRDPVPGPGPVRGAVLPAGQGPLRAGGRAPARRNRGLPMTSPSEVTARLARPRSIPISRPQAGSGWPRVPPRTRHSSGRPPP